MKSTSLIVCISLALSGAALAQQSNEVQGSVSGAAAASASAERDQANASGSVEGSAVAATHASAANVAQGAELHATLDKPVDARNAKVGDEVKATLSKNIEFGGRVVVSKGAKLVGRVAAAQPLKRAKGSAEASGDSELAIVFDRAVLKDGREVPLHATVQALAAAESRASAGMSDAHAGMGAAGAAAGSMRSNGGGLVGGVAGGAARTVGGVAGGAGGMVHSGAAASGRMLAKSPGAVGGLDATGGLKSGSQGVFGFDGVNVASATNAGGSVLTSSSRNVRLDRGTRMLLVNGGAAGAAAGEVSKGPSGATLDAAGGASGAANVTRENASQPAPESTRRREPVDHR